jgi:hypothetical protein
MPDALPGYDAWKLDTPPRLATDADADGGPWCVELDIGGRWVPVAAGFRSRDVAEWFVGQWKETNRMTGDPFRYRRG